MDVQGCLGVGGKAGASLDRVLIACFRQQAARSVEFVFRSAERNLQLGGQVVDDAYRVDGCERHIRNAIWTRLRSLGSCHDVHGSEAQRRSWGRRAKISAVGIITGVVSCH